MERKRPPKKWKLYTKFWCQWCDRETYRDTGPAYQICRKCDRLLTALDTQDFTKKHEVVKFRPETVTHFHRFKNGKEVAVTNKGNTLSDYDTRKFELAAKKRHNRMKLPTKSDWQDL